MARVLVVLDDEMVRRGVARALERAGHAVHATGDRHDAQDRVRDAPVDALLVGHPLGRSSGIGTLATLREVAPGAARLLMADDPEPDALLAAINRACVHRVLPSLGAARAVVGIIDDLLGAPSPDAPLSAVGSDARALAACFEGDDLGIALQPIVRPRATPMTAGRQDGDIYAYEVLARSTRGAWASTPEMVAAAERAGMLGALSSAVVSRLAACIADLPGQARVFVNLHPTELYEREALPRRLEPLAPWAHRVVLEITERAGTQAFDRWSETLGELSAMGFSLALDDLGSGYSGLRMLAELQPDYIKIDMGIVRDVDVEPQKQRLVELICRFADATGARVVAEGVETADEADMLVRSGVHLLQGYLYGRPQPVG